MSAHELADKIYEWGRRNGVLTEGFAVPTGKPLALQDIVEGDAKDLAYAQERLSKARIVGVVADDVHNEVTILTKGMLGPRIAKLLPETMSAVSVSYIGGADVGANPPVPVPASTSAHPPCHLHKNRIACGSSVTAAPVFGAGTLGCLVRTGDGRICGLSNNHVTGDCNHTPLNMHILSPSPFDADPQGPPPSGIGRHFRLVQLQSGDPGQITEQELDVALFTIEDLDRVSSMQGDGYYDTPRAPTSPVGKMLVKKTGRTTGLTTGTVIGPWVTPLWIPYKSQRFSSVVHFRGIWAVKGDDDEPFSEPGDSGSLVVTHDSQYAVGLIFAGAGDVSLMIPIHSVLKELCLTLVGGHNV